MPMDFTNMKSLERAATVHEFREPAENETEEQFRLELHKHVKPIDRIESYEIKFGIGWDQWSSEQKRESIGM